MQIKGDTLVMATPAQITPASAPVNTGADFNEIGTLVFYPNNVGPVPYIFYQDQRGNTTAKALTFPGATPANFSSWTGARISVTGTLDKEHVVVSRIVYTSAP